MNFINKFHVNSTELECEHTLREERTRLNEENI